VATVAERLQGIWGEESSLQTWLTTVDHKRIGLKYLYTGLIFFVVGGIEALILRVQLAQPNLEVLDPEAYNQLFTMHGTTMMFLFAIPALSGFGNYLVPLMIGTRDMAFPRLNAFGYWVFLGAGIFMYSSFLVGSVPDAGWFNYVPLANEDFTPGLQIEFYSLGLLFLGISTTAGVINFIVTILKMRAPGMSINRMPIFVWGELAMALATVFAVPMLTIALSMLFLERKFGFHFFDDAFGGSPILWQHLFWIFGHPLVYIIVLPALGIVSAIIPTFSRRRMIGYTYIVLAELAIALLGFGVWVHHMFAIGIPQLSLSFISVASFMITIPSGTQIFAWLTTMVSGRPKFKTPMMFVFGFIFVFVIGGLSGVMFASVPFDQATTDTYFVVAHFHYVLVGGAVFPILAAIYHWGPKITGRMFDERMGHWSFWTTFIGFNLTFGPMHVAGLAGQPRRTYTYAEGLGWDLPNLLSTVGAFLFALGVGLIAYNWFRSARHGDPAGNDPWGGETLEWATTSPPPHYNFETIPRIRSREPMWDQPDVHGGAQPEDRGGTPLTGGHLTLSTSMLDATPQAIVHMPHASPWPVALTAALFVFFLGALVTSLPVAVIGGALVMMGAAGWFWPKGETQET
jgi:cytochrome c oxidase subunit I+III